MFTYTLLTRMLLCLKGRVEELRQVKEAQYWGREKPPKRDLPAFWSIRTHGQPFNDERLFNGATNVYQVRPLVPLVFNGASGVQRCLWCSMGPLWCSMVPLWCSTVPLVFNGASGSCGASGAVCTEREWEAHTSWQNPESEDCPWLLHDEPRAVSGQCLHPPFEELSVTHALQGVGLEIVLQGLCQDHFGAPAHGMFLAYTCVVPVDALATLEDFHVEGI